jgi:preprotein translocase subunit SecA
VLGGNVKGEITALGENTDPQEVQRLKNEWQQRHDVVLAAGGLHIVGTERHESRRIDNQLRGRSGRQGDPGSSRFYLSLEDGLMRIFASDRVTSIMQKLGMEEGEAIEHPWVTKAIENAQRKVEGRNFDIRKQLLEYDDVANDQRKVIYEQRNELMESEDISETIKAIRYDVLTAVINTYVPPSSLEELWDTNGLEAALEQRFAVKLPITQWLHDEHDLHEAPLRQRILDHIETVYVDKETHVGAAVMRHFEKAIMLQILDGHWKEHLAAMDYLRQGIHLRGYAQKNPKQEYKREAFEMFERLLGRVKEDVIDIVSKVQIRAEQEVEAIEQQRRQAVPMEFQHARVDGLTNEYADDAERQAAARPEEPVHQPFVRNERKIGRNEPCPCGSGKKYKHCHGQTD